MKKKLHIVHFGPSDIKGGAALAGYRLHCEFLKNPALDSTLFVHDKYTDDVEVIKFSKPILRQIERVLNRIGYYTGLQYFFSVNWLPLIFYKKFWQADIFIIRNIHGGYLPIWFPYLLSKIAPVIWRLADLWPFTSHCVYYNASSHDPVKGCARQEYPAIFLSTERFLLKVKKFLYTRSLLTLVAPSHWMQSEVENSILVGLPVTHIPTGVDENIFKPVKKSDTLTLIFISVALNDVRKGSTILPAILEELNHLLQHKYVPIRLLVIGEIGGNLGSFGNITIDYRGFLKEKELASALAEAHVFILPTVADNLPNTIIEALACGTGTVVFDVGGCKDAVIHGETGYLAKPGDIQDFVHGIEFMMFNDEKRKNSPQACRALFLERFTLMKQAENYAALIKNILKQT